MRNRSEVSILIRTLVKYFIIFPIKLLFKTVKKIHLKLLKKLRFSITFKITTVYTWMFTKFLLLLSLCICAGFIAYLGINVRSNMLKDLKMASSYSANSFEFPKNNIYELSLIDNIDINIFDENYKLIYTTEKNNSSVIFYDKSNSKDLSNICPNFLLHFEDNDPIIDINELIKEDDTKPLNSNFKLILTGISTWNSKTIHIQVTNGLYKEIASIFILIVSLISLNFLFILFALISGSRASRRMLRPIEKMTKTVKSITIQALDTRLDISGSQDELKELAETFNNMLDRIQHSVEIQNQFVSDASHELRTPISVIQGYANLLDRWGKDDKEVLQESITAIKSESENMKNLVERLLFLARSDKNTQKVEFENFNSCELIEEILKETKMIDASHEILSEKNENLEIYADRKLLKEALRIFIDNSIKYTPIDGKIKLNSFLENSKLIITIEDTGMGIAKEDLPSIFNRFYRADKSRTKETGGTGLGLAIAKWIILRHKGTIEVESQLNVGTKISLLLPIIASENYNASSAQ